MRSMKPSRMACLLSIAALVGCSALETSPQYAAGSFATEEERYCHGVAQYEADRVKRENLAQSGVGAAAGAAVGGLVGRNLEQDRTIEGATIGALGGASAACLATKDEMLRAYDTAYRRCMDARRAQSW